MRPTDAQQVEAHRPRPPVFDGAKGEEARYKPNLDPRSNPDLNLDRDFDRLRLQTHRDHRPVDLPDRQQKSSGSEKHKTEAVKEWVGRSVIEVDSKGHRQPANSRTKDSLSTLKPFVLPSGSRTTYRDDTGKPRPTALDRPASSSNSQPQTRPNPVATQQGSSSASSSSYSRPSTTVSSSDYAKFKSTGAFASPARPTASAFEVAPSSPFYRPQKPQSRVLPQDSWMVAQMNAHHAQQRQNGRPPSASSGPSMGQAYGIAAGYAAKSAAAATAGSSAALGVNKEEDGEDFSAALNNVQVDPSDYTRVSADQAEADMRELLSGAIGDGEDNTGGVEDGSNLVDGFAEGMSLMPHQIRGVSWMGKREVGTKRGGILADVSLRGKKRPLRGKLNVTHLSYTLGYGSGEDRTDYRQHFEATQKQGRGKAGILHNDVDRYSAVSLARSSHAQAGPMLRVDIPHIGPSWINGSRRSRTRPLQVD